MEIEDVARMIPTLYADSIRQIFDYGPFTPRRGEDMAFDWWHDTGNQLVDAWLAGDEAAAGALADLMPHYEE